MLDTVRRFLAANWDGKSPLMLGYSGGPDSKALLYALMEAGCRTLHIAHVDHGWREESAQEALDLKEEAARLGLPFHTTRLCLERNREDVSREGRLKFFHSLFGKIPFQALLLAHHADDAAETALKRVLEGAHLPFLGGMEPVSRLEGMDVWRPFLREKKEAVLTFLKERGLEPLVDSTNFDPAYLRARMRLDILPALAARFGKGISDNLALLGERAAELKSYLDHKTKGRSVFKGPWGMRGSLAGLERIEARHLLQEWTQLPRGPLEAALNALEAGRPNCKIGQRVIVDRGQVFVLAEKFPSWGNQPLRLEEGVLQSGDWRVEVKRGEADRRCGWEEVWSGRFSATVPAGWLEMPRAGSPLSHLWNEKKVPAFFRRLVPIVRGEQMEREFLTGKQLQPKSIREVQDKLILFCYVGERQALD